VPWINIHLRGERPLGKVTRLSFRYRLSGTDNLRVMLANSKKGVSHASIPVNKLRQGEWAEATVDFAAAKLDKGLLVDEVNFVLPKGAELLVDDVVLYEPGS
jgi:hypothetical protein